MIKIKISKKLKENRHYSESTLINYFHELFNLNIEQVEINADFYLIEINEDWTNNRPIIINFLNKNCITLGLHGCPHKKTAINYISQHISKKMYDQNCYNNY